MNTCTLCLQEKPLSEFEKNSAMKSGYLNQCKTCKYERRKQSPNFAETKSATHRKWRLTSRYGITPEQYDEMWEAQEGLCAICKQPECHELRRLAVDHDHATGANRKLLCCNCNLLLGHAKDKIEVLKSAIEYLEQSSEVPK